VTDRQRNATTRGETLGHNASDLSHTEMRELKLVPRVSCVRWWEGRTPHQQTDDNTARDVRWSAIGTPSHQPGRNTQQHQDLIKNICNSI